MEKSLLSNIILSCTTFPNSTIPTTSHTSRYYCLSTAILELIFSAKKQFS